MELLFLAILQRLVQERLQLPHISVLYHFDGSSKNLLRHRADSSLIPRNSFAAFIFPGGALPLLPSAAHDCSP